MKKLLSTSLLLLLSTILFAQSGTIRGFVYDKESAEPIIFCNVSLEGTTLGAPTDVNGYFSIPNVPAGDYKIIITFSYLYTTCVTYGKYKVYNCLTFIG